MKFYIVTEDNKPSLIAYAKLSDAQDYIKDRSKPSDYKDQTSLYKVFSMKDYKVYRIEEVTVIE